MIHEINDAMLRGAASRGGGIALSHQIHVHGNVRAKYVNLPCRTCHDCKK